MKNQANNQKSFDVVIPSNVFYHADLTITGIRLYDLIRRLSKKEGYCYARNCSLAKELGCDIRSVQRGLRDLKRFGFVYSRVVKRKRGLFISDPEEHQKCRMGGDKNGAQGETILPPILEENVTRRETNEGRSVPLASEKYEKPKEKVWKEMKDKYPPERFKEVFEMVDNYQGRLDNPAGFMVRALQKGWKAKGEPADKARELANKILNLYPHLCGIGKDIDIGYNYVAFPRANKEFSFTDRNFEDTILEYLDHMKLDTTHLKANFGLKDNRHD